MSNFDTSRPPPALASVFEPVQCRDPAQAEFHQVVYEVLLTIVPLIEHHPEYADLAIIDRIAEPECQIQFRVLRADDKGNTHTNRGFRVEYNFVLDPYKGGLRFHPPVNLSVTRSLGFEQISKNVLTGLSMDGGKGGTDFDPKGKSDAEVTRFCQSLMTELSCYIGPDTGVPAGDISVGGHEIGYMLGQYKHLENCLDVGVLTDKGLSWGGSYVHTEATGYGFVYFVAETLAVKGTSFDGKRVVVSGPGNITIYAAEKIQQLGAIVVAVSDFLGYVVDEASIDVALLKDTKEVHRGRVSGYTVERPGVVFVADGSTQDVPCDIVPPCTTQNELPLPGVETLIKNGVQPVIEGANMPTAPEAIEALQTAGVVYAPDKASNAGGVVISGLEMQQNPGRTQWPFEEADVKLYQIMVDIHTTTVATAEGYGVVGNYVASVNLTDFHKVADAMTAMGLI